MADIPFTWPSWLPGYWPADPGKPPTCTGSFCNRAPVNPTLTPPRPAPPGTLVQIPGSPRSPTTPTVPDVGGTIGRSSASFPFVYAAAPRPRPAPRRRRPPRRAPKKTPPRPRRPATRPGRPKLPDRPLPKRLPLPLPKSVPWWARLILRNVEILLPQPKPAPRPPTTPGGPRRGKYRPAAKAPPIVNPDRDAELRRRSAAYRREQEELDVLRRDAEILGRIGSEDVLPQEDPLEEARREAESKFPDQDFIFDPPPLYSNYPGLPSFDVPLPGGQPMPGDVAQVLPASAPAPWTMPVSDPFFGFVPTRPEFLLPRQQSRRAPRRSPQRTRLRELTPNSNPALGLQPGSITLPAQQSSPCQQAARDAKRRQRKKRKECKKFVYKRIKVCQSSNAKSR